MNGVHGFEDDGDQSVCLIVVTVGRGTPEWQKARSQIVRHDPPSALAIYSSYSTVQRDMAIKSAMTDWGETARMEPAGGAQFPPREAIA